jgi:Fur family ferric uptake transcriptional regulator
MKGLQHYLRQQLSERGLRVTRERQLILDHAFEHFGHFDSEELLESLNRHGIKVSRATVYRTLPQLVEIGLLRRHEIGDRQKFYEPSFGRKHHEHLICVECGTITEFVQEQIEALQEEICDRHEFKALNHTLQIHGLCKKCQSSSTDPDSSQDKRPKRAKTRRGGGRSG